MAAPAAVCWRALCFSKPWRITSPMGREEGTAGGHSPWHGLTRTPARQPVGLTLSPWWVMRGHPIMTRTGACETSWDFNSFTTIGMRFGGKAGMGQIQDLSNHRSIPAACLSPSNH